MQASVRAVAARVSAGLPLPRYPYSTYRLTRGLLSRNASGVANLSSSEDLAEAKAEKETDSAPTRALPPDVIVYGTPKDIFQETKEEWKRLGKVRRKVERAFDEKKIDVHTADLIAAAAAKAQMTHLWHERVLVWQQLRTAKEAEDLPRIHTLTEIMNTHLQAATELRGTMEKLVNRLKKIQPPKALAKSSMNPISETMEKQQTSLSTSPTTSTMWPRTRPSEDLHPRPVPVPPLPAPSNKYVSLIPLPPFVTLSDLSRISLHAGASAANVLGLKIYSGTPTRARIQFRFKKDARQFVEKPLLLEVQRPDPASPSTPAPVAVEIFPSANAPAPLSLSERLALHAGTRPWNEHDYNARPTKNTSIASGGPISVDKTAAPRTGKNDAPYAASASNEQIPAAQLHTPEETLTFPAAHSRMIFSVRVRFSQPRSTPSPDIPFSCTRWISLRVPGVPSLPPRSPEKTSDPPSEAESEPDSEPEYDDETVTVYARALRKAVGRERELEAALRHQEAEAQERALELACLTAEAQLRADWGALGTLEGVWVRAKPAQSKQAPVIDSSSARELHALIAFSNAKVASDAMSIVPVQKPVYADSDPHFAQMVPKTILEWRHHSIPASHPVVRDGEGAGGARDGWVRRLEREHRAEVLMREREKERERQRGAAEGTWGNERLSEIRERIRRMQRREEREREQAALPSLWNDFKGILESSFDSDVDAGASAVSEPESIDAETISDAAHEHDSSFPRLSKSFEGSESVQVPKLPVTEQKPLPDSSVVFEMLETVPAGLDAGADSSLAIDAGADPAVALEISGTGEVVDAAKLEEGPEEMMKAQQAEEETKEL
ncbi:hypothetical protein C8R46DRAFT_370515 [Mycena filopes]|nr:hypothetical protein C8R46DRAFT_370515 [Mycena filopes]